MVKDGFLRFTDGHFAHEKHETHENPSFFRAFRVFRGQICVYFSSICPSFVTISKSPSLNRIRSHVSGVTEPDSPTATKLRFSRMPSFSMGNPPYITTRNSPGSLVFATAVRPRLTVPARCTTSAAGWITDG